MKIPRFEPPAFVNETVGQVWKQFKPPRAFSWQTLILISIFTWCVSVVVETELVRDVLARLGWIFLMLGVGWGMSGARINVLGLVIYPGPWITGALACVALFAGWNVDLTQVALVSWPLISFMVAAIPRFFPKLVFSVPDPATRQQLLIQFLLSCMFSAWFQFHFVIQNWFREYPSLLADNLNRGSFVVRLDQQGSDLPRGVVLLNLAEPLLQKELQALPWAEVERWLLERETRVAALQQQVLQQTPRVQEDALWKFLGDVPAGLPEYTLKLRAVWLGPSSNLGGYFLEKSCLITQATNATLANPAIPNAAVQVTCQPVGDKILIDPQPLVQGEG